MTVLYRAGHIEICHEAVTNILCCRWFGVQQTDKIMEAGMEILLHVKDKGITRVLNDNRAVRGPWLNAAKWADEEWFPLMMDAGLKHFAWILPVNVFAEISAKVAMRHATVVCTFKSYHEAYRWLVAQQ